MGCNFSSRVRPRDPKSPSEEHHVNIPAAPSTEDVVPMQPGAAYDEIAQRRAAPLRVEEAGDANKSAGRTPVTDDEASRVYRGVRNGRVLRKQTVLKADHYPSSHNAKLPEQIEGAPNFRQPSDMPIFGTAAPTFDGLRAVCHRVAPTKQHPIVWCNLRQEPCIYIHGRPFSVKERDAVYRVDSNASLPLPPLAERSMPPSLSRQPFKAMENKGLQLSDVEQSEALLKLEVLAEARRFGGRLLVLDERPPGDVGGLCAKGSLYSYWETAISGASVWTPREMYELACLQEGHVITYCRVPITDEQAPHEDDFDAIVRHMQDGHTANPSTSYVFNCALGRGRTTTGLSIACLTWRAIASDAQLTTWDLSSVRVLSERPADFGWGEYASVRALTALLPSGRDRKAFVDCVIDRCAHMQNLRTDILPKKRDTEDAALTAKKRESALVTGRKYLERYLYLILFNAYVCRNIDRKSSQYRPPQGHRPRDFKEWLDGEERIGERLYPMLDALTLE